MATCQTLKSSHHSHTNELISVEKGLVQSLADLDDPGALHQIIEMMGRRTEDGKR